MKVYQCIHKYPPHIPLFEARHGISNIANLTFNELQKLVIEDGYASAYILQPALEHKTDEVFFTIWDYKRLQYLWAKENGLNTTDLKKIKLAQIENFKPDVVYNQSPFCDFNFIKQLLPIKGSMKLVCWNGFIEAKPRTFPDYDCHLTLHRPFVDFWRKAGLQAFELQPGIPANWVTNSVNSIRTIDALFYGQFSQQDNNIFSQRSNIIESLIKYKIKYHHKIDIHLQINATNIYGIPLTSRFNFVQKIKSRFYKENSLAPIYGDELSKKISSSKIVINGYGDNNQEYKSNMRLFESIGLGAFLISEQGNYPEGFEQGTDFYTYTDYKSLELKIEKVLSDWPYHQSIAQKTQHKIANLYSKKKQWTLFQDYISKL